MSSANAIVASSTTLQVSEDSTFSSDVFTYTSEYTNTHNFVKGDLPYGVNLFARVKYTGTDSSDREYESGWSSVIQFQVAIPSEIIGVCMDNSNTSAKGTFSWIDACGNQISSFNFQNHPTFSGISMATVDSRANVTLTKFPKFYVKTMASGPTGSFAANKKCWWISPVEEADFHPAACFKRSTQTDGNGKFVVSDYCYMGTYLGHSETVGGKTCLGSKKGQTVLASTTKANFKTYITNRNDASAGVTGFRMFDIWDLGALRMLSLIAKADSDTQTVWGDNSAGTSYPKTGSTNARILFQGTHANPIVSMEDMWRCYWYHADLITVNNGVVTLTSPMDLTTALSFGSAAASRYTQPTTSGWIRDVLDCPFTIGDDVHDLMELFLPGSVVSAENQGTFSDYHYGGDYARLPGDLNLITGGHGEAPYDNRVSINGLFIQGHMAPPEIWDHVGSRLSKN